MGSMYYRMIDALAEAHLMACSQKKEDIASLLLSAIEIEWEKYGRRQNEKREGIDMLELAQTRQQKMDGVH
ncbi:hypothetical protein [Aestuariispira insulae]|uniref:Uncharacterized protein n=1 Tax=Aestuariispira insulae TaxID=1461337 RepID=A0A3D9HPD7_9PROT|nr:hypothetical protein [Aestuariispira insulae]RED51275.1 hypothetical protein DFP90_10375 [Aestuariispira insulae]